MPPREPSPYHLAKLIKRARRQMTNAIRERLEPFGSSLPVVQLMRRVVEGGQQSQLELARQIELEPATLCRLVVELEAKRLVVRQRDVDDNRRVLVEATAAGATFLARAQPHVLAGIETMTSRLTSAERGELCRLLEKLAEDDDAPGAQKAIVSARARPRAAGSARATPAARVGARAPARAGRRKVKGEG